MNRKDFFKHAGRWVILSGIGLLSAFLLAEQKVVTPENCSAGPLCRNCGKYAKCELPQVTKERKNGK